MENDWTFLPNEAVSANSTPGMSHGGSTPSHMTSAMKKLPENIPSVEHFADEQFLLHQIDESHLQTEFNLDGIDFIVPDDLGANSKAFPPSEFPQNTPALMPKSEHLPPSFQSPILPSQNEKSYNEEHFIQKHRQRRSHQQVPHQLHAQLLQQLHQLHLLHSHQQQQQHVRPDAVFTPLVSPAVTPMDLQVNTNKQSYSAIQTSFEPLTSPALNAQPAAVNADRRRSLSATFGPEDYNGGNQAKRKTPHLTPNLAAHPGSKVKRSTSLIKVPQLFEALPDSSYEGNTKSSETTPMLPPQGKRIVIESQVSGANTPSANVGPGTLMGFTMNRLAELQSNRSSSPSPSLTPNTAKPQRKIRRDSNSSQRSTGRGYVKAENSSLSEASPVLEAQNGEYGGRREKPATKKASHKLAEQGRRNRMNQAVYELSKLIPSNYHEQVSIPSKATTVELAATYIRHLMEELDELKYQQKDGRS